MTNITAYRVFFVLTDCEQVDGALFFAFKRAWRDRERRERWKVSPSQSGPL